MDLEPIARHGNLTGKTLLLPKSGNEVRSSFSSILAGLSRAAGDDRESANRSGTQQSEAVDTVIPKDAVAETAADLEAKDAAFSPDDPNTNPMSQSPVSARAIPDVPDGSSTAAGWHSAKRQTRSHGFPAVPAREIIPMQGSAPADAGHPRAGNGDAPQSSSGDAPLKPGLLAGRVHNETGLQDEHVRPAAMNRATMPFAIMPAAGSVAEFPSVPAPGQARPATTPGLMLLRGSSTTLAGELPGLGPGSLSALDRQVAVDRRFAAGDKVPTRSAPDAKHHVSRITAADIGHKHLLSPTHIDHRESVSSPPPRSLAQQTGMPGDFRSVTNNAAKGVGQAQTIVRGQSNPGQSTGGASEKPAGTGHHLLATTQAPHRFSASKDAPGLRAATVLSKQGLTIFLNGISADQPGTNRPAEPAPVVQTPSMRHGAAPGRFETLVASPAADLARRVLPGAETDARRGRFMQHRGAVLSGYETSLREPEVAAQSARSSGLQTATGRSHNVARIDLGRQVAADPPARVVPSTIAHAETATGPQPVRATGTDGASMRDAPAMTPMNSDGAPRTNPTSSRGSSDAAAARPGSNRGGPAGLTDPVPGKMPPAPLTEAEATAVEPGRQAPEGHKALIASARAAPPNLSQHVGRQMAEAVSRTAERSLEIRLNPAELGKVRMQILGSESAIIIQVVAERSETLDLMRRHADQLAQEFRNLGHGSVNLSFTSGRDTGGHGTRHGFGSGIDRGDRPDSAPTAPPARIAEMRGNWQTDGLDLRL